MKFKGMGCFVVVVFLLFFRPSLGWNVYGTSDGHCYVQWLYTMLGLSYTAGCPVDSTFAPGIALFWWPLAAVASAVSWITSLSHYLMIMIAIGLSSFLCWAIGLRLYLSWFRQAGIPYWGMLFVLSIPVLYYSTSRTTWSHAGEFLCTTAFFFSLHRKKLKPAFLLAALGTLVRFNNVFMLFVFIAAVLEFGQWNQRTHRKFILTALITCLGFTSLISYLGFVSGYHGMTVPILMEALSLNRLATVLWGSDWGLLWTSPAWLLLLGTGLCLWKKQGPIEKACTLWLTSHFFLVVAWLGNGSDFSYRYLIGSFGAAAWLWLFFLKRLSRSWQVLSKSLIFASALWMTSITWVYRTSETLSPQFVIPDWPAMTPRFQWKAWEALLSLPNHWQAFKLSALGELLCGLGSDAVCQDMTYFTLPTLWTVAAALGLGLSLFFFRNTIRPFLSNIWDRLSLQKKASNLS